MAISLYFGLPGCGKTTLMAKIAFDAIKSKNISTFIVTFTIPFLVLHIFQMIL